MNKNVLSALIVLLVVSSSSLAHHGTGVSYDQTKSVILTGTLTKFSWTNPHCYVELDVKNSSGQVVHWAGEMNSPGVLKVAGWTRETIKAGDQVTLSVHPAKAGTPVGVVDRGKPIIANGKEILPASNASSEN
jgi:uncharacterized protein DUF6152